MTRDDGGGWKSPRFRKHRRGASACDEARSGSARSLGAKSGMYMYNWQRNDWQAPAVCTVAYVRLKMWDNSAFAPRRSFVRSRATDKTEWASIELCTHIRIHRSMRRFMYRHTCNKPELDMSDKAYERRGERLIAISISDVKKKDSLQVLRNRRNCFYFEWLS